MLCERSLNDAFFLDSRQSNRNSHMVGNHRHESLISTLYDAVIKTYINYSIFQTHSFHHSRKKIFKKKFFFRRKIFDSEMDYQSNIVYAEVPVVDGTTKFETYYIPRISNESTGDVSKR